MMDKKYLPYLIIASFFLVIYSFIYFSNQKGLKEAENTAYITPKEAIEDENKEILERKFIKVYISGEVNEPGVFEFDSSMRIEDGIIQAGGATENADLERINLAAYLKDGEQIHVPHIDDTAAQNVGETNSKININHASLDELESLPGIGTERAKAIVKYREMNGSFTEATDIMKVTGISNKIFENLADLIVAP